jgi:hypothetical protein
LNGREPIPLGPLVANQLFRLNHAKGIAQFPRLPKQKLSMPELQLLAQSSAILSNQGRTSFHCRNCPVLRLKKLRFALPSICAIPQLAAPTALG